MLQAHTMASMYVWGFEPPDYGLGLVEFLDGDDLRDVDGYYGREVGLLLGMLARVKCANGF